ncbi:MAG: hypothetical protein JRD93_05570 [Deltaproteobacteria bacterium]|nr:hypothetical protein [Deltaproteobacteria bacterium]
MIKETIEKKKASGSKNFYIDYSGGEPEPIKDIESLEIGQESITFDNGRSVDIKNVIGILAGNKKIIIFAHKGVRSVSAESEEIIIFA